MKFIVDHKITAILDEAPEREFRCHGPYCAPVFVVHGASEKCIMAPSIFAEIETKCLQTSLPTDNR